MTLTFKRVYEYGGDCKADDTDYICGYRASNGVMIEKKFADGLDVYCWKIGEDYYDTLNAAKNAVIRKANEEPTAPQEAANEPGADATQAAADNKAATMTAQEITARKMIAEQTTEYLLKTFEGTTTNNDPFIPTVRGWLMDELQSRYPEAYDKWLDSEVCEDAALREYINAAIQAEQDAANSAAGQPATREAETVSVTEPKGAISYYDIPHVANDRYIPVAAFKIDLKKNETRLFSRALAEYACAVDIPDTLDGDYEIMRRFDCVRMLTRLTQSLFEATLDSDSAVTEFHFFPPIFQETESYVRYVMFHTLNAVERLIKEDERHLKSATEARFNDTAEFYRERLTALQGIDSRIRLAFERGFQAATAAA